MKHYNYAGMSNRQELVEEQKLLSIVSFLTLCSSAGRYCSSPKYKYLARTSLREISVKTIYWTSLRIMLILSPKENVVSSY